MGYRNMLLTTVDGVNSRESQISRSSKANNLEQQTAADIAMLATYVKAIMLDINELEKGRK